MRDRRWRMAGCALVGVLSVWACRRRETVPAETPGQVIVERIDPGSPLARAGLLPGDVLLAVRGGGGRMPLRAFTDLWLAEVEHAPRGPVVLEVLRGGARLERSLPEERWRTAARPALTAAGLRLLHRAQAAAAAGKPDEAVATYERLRESGVPADVRAWASVRAAQLRRGGFDARWERAGVEARAAGGEGLAAWIALKRCESLAETGAFAAAPPQCERARAGFLKLGQPLAATEAAYRMAVIAGRRGNPREEERGHRAVALLLAPLAPEGLLAVRNLRGLAKSRATQGDLQAAFTHARRALAIVERRAPGGLDHGASRMILGIFHWFAQEWAAAQADLVSALEIVQAVDPAAEDVPNVLSNLGMVSASRGDLAGAEEYYRRGLEAFARTGAQDPLAVSRTLNNLATVAYARGDVASAVQYDREVLELRERLVPGSIDLAVPLLNLGDHLVGLGRLDEAERHLQRALDLQRGHTPDSGDVARTLLNLTDVRRRRGDDSGAETLAVEALAVAARREPASVLEAIALRSLAELRGGRGQRVDAEGLLRRSASLLETLVPGTLEQARTLHALARLLRAAGRPEAALAPLRGAAAALDRQLATLGGTDEVRARFRESWRHVYRDLADLLLELGMKDEAFESLERSRARGFLLLLRSRDLRLTAGVPPEIERERRTLASAYEDVQEKLAEHLAAHDDAAVRKLEAERRRLQLRRDQLAERLGRDVPRLAGLEAVAGLSAARAALGGQVAALSYFVDEKKTRLSVLGAGGRIEILDLPIGQAELRDLVDRFRFLLETPSPSADPAPLGARLYQILVAPAAPLLAGASSLLIVPDGPLHRLSFAALVEGGEAGRASYLVERLPLQMAASITAWIELRRLRRGDSGPFVGFADPEVPDLQRVARRARSGPLSRLPYSRLEAERLAALFGPDARVVEGAQASELAARQAGPGARVLHFATHAYVDPFSPLDSALVLAPATDAAGRRDDGLLQAWEVVQDLRLDAELVALSACETGGGAAVGDEGLLGLTRAFHFAGARAVLASLWKVYDRSTAALMERFYTHWAAGESKAAALRAAQLELIREGAPPSLWAAFELHGDGR